MPASTAPARRKTPDRTPRAPQDGVLGLTDREAAWLLGVHTNTARAMRERGELPTVRIGRRVLTPRAAVEAYLAAV